MPRVIATIELNCDGFEANMTLDGKAQEFAKLSLGDLIKRGEIVTASVRVWDNIQIDAEAGKRHDLLQPLGNVSLAELERGGRFIKALVDVGL